MNNKRIYSFFKTVMIKMSMCINIFQLGSLQYENIECLWFTAKYAMVREVS